MNAQKIKDAIFIAIAISGLYQLVFGFLWLSNGLSIPTMVIGNGVVWIIIGIGLWINNDSRSK